MIASFSGSSKPFLIHFKTEKLEGGEGGEESGNKALGNETANDMIRVHLRQLYAHERDTRTFTKCLKTYCILPSLATVARAS